MASKKSKNNSVIGSIIAVVIIIAIALFGGDTQVLNILTASASDNVKSENIENLQNVSVITGNDCISKIPDDGYLRVYCFDVGQGDSILIVNEGKTMLIDASTNEMGSTVVNYLKQLGISKIDYLIGTHPHEDHIGGLDNVIKNFDIKTIYMPKVVATTKTYEDVIDAIADKKLKVTSPKIGNTFNVGNANCEIMYTGNNKDEYNECSIVVKMEFNGVSYLFTGDANDNVEESRQWPQIDVLKVGHHGSSTSTTTKFLNQIQPKVALISVGEGNKYGHPTESVLKRLNKIGAKTYRTDEDETILIVGKN
ncbi:MAG: MBL fold metallo-hydrolase [Clostridia bacterium]|nr:MBL fold metallo-hydrolase [Clostridia bacterium]